jgi:hypothetical protein|tara:strand:- start:953 stop:1216 length:264 start_codon:yes stop_codon:yes gene_type:complete
MLGSDHSPFRLKSTDFEVRLAKAGFLYAAVFSAIGLLLIAVVGELGAGLVSLLIGLAFTFSAVPSFLKVSELERNRVETARSAGRSI